MKDAASPPSDRAAQAHRLALAIDAIEAELAGLEPGASPRAIAEALAGPVKAFDALAKAMLREPNG
jgi:hypothetical protein